MLDQNNGSGAGQVAAAQRSWLQIGKFLTMAGVGLFADGYLNITIGLVVPMLGFLYYADAEKKNSFPTVPGDVIKGTLSIGMIMGQLTFGIMGDAIGRRVIYGKELMITMFGTLMVIVMPTYLSHTGITAWLAMFRLLTGFGIGADYPMSSTLSAEKNQFFSRGKLVTSVFSFIGLGYLAATLVFLVLLTAFKNDINGDYHRIEWVWRLLLGFGIIPAACTLYSRLRMRESAPYQKYVTTTEADDNAGKSRGVSTQWAEFRDYFSDMKHARVLFATSACWFLFDIAFYGVNLNQSVILSQIGFGSGKTPYETLHNLAIGNLIVAVAGYVPGYYAAIPLVDRLGRVRQQFLGCVIVSVLYAIWAGVTDHTSTGGLITLFTLSQFFLNCGPNATTFLIPVEVFPTRVRATAHGISAASGKAGAVLTTFAFGTVTDAIGLSGTLGIMSGVIALCAVITLLIPETKGLSLDEIESGVVFGLSEAPGSPETLNGKAGKDGCVEEIRQLSSNGSV